MGYAAYSVFWFIVVVQYTEETKLWIIKNKVNNVSGEFHTEIKWKKSRSPTNVAKRKREERTKIKTGDTGTPGTIAASFDVFCLFCIYFFAPSTRVRFTIVTSLVANKDFKRRGSFANCLQLDVVGVVLCVRGLSGPCEVSERRRLRSARRPARVAASLLTQILSLSCIYSLWTLNTLYCTSVLYFFSSRLIFSCHIRDSLKFLIQVSQL
jgi:hypothetical protein